jgi:hypothetical protein
MTQLREEQQSQRERLIDSIRIVTLTIPSPGHRIKDSDVGEEIDKMKHATLGTASVTKPLYSQDQAKTFFKRINATRNAIRAAYTNMTVPWGKLRAMNVADGRLQAFHAMYQEWQTSLLEAVDALQEPKDDGSMFTHPAGAGVQSQTMWGLMQAVAPLTLGDWYDASQYPTWEEFREQYRMEPYEVISVNPNDLPMDISVEERERLRQEATARLTERMQESSLSIANQLLAFVANMATVLSKEKPKIFETLVTNIEGLCDNAGNLNVSNDPNITEIINQARNLTAYSATDLRASAELRQFASAEAREVAERIQDVAVRLGGSRRVLDLQPQTQEEE